MNKEKKYQIITILSTLSVSLSSTKTLLIANLITPYEATTCCLSYQELLILICLELLGRDAIQIVS